MLTHRQRVEKVRNFTDKNKLFSAISVIIITVLIGNFVIKCLSAKEKEMKPTTTVTSEIEDETVDTNINEEANQSKPTWRFYWIDLWILLIGGGFCTIKILQERKKSKEKL